MKGMSMVFPTLRYHCCKRSTIQLTFFRTYFSRAHAGARWICAFAYGPSRDITTVHSLRWRTGRYGLLTVPSDWSVPRLTEHKRMKCKILLLKTWSSTQASRHVNETKKGLQTNVLGEFFHYGASESTELWILICDRIGDCLVSGTRN